MRRFKQSNKNMKFAKEVLKIAKKYGAKNFNTYSDFHLANIQYYLIIIKLVYG